MPADRAEQCWRHLCFTALNELLRTSTKWFHSWLRGWLHSRLHSRLHSWLHSWLHSRLHSWLHRRLPWLRWLSWLGCRRAWLLNGKLRGGRLKPRTRASRVASMPIARERFHRRRASALRTSSRLSRKGGEPRSQALRFSWLRCGLGWLRRRRHGWLRRQLLRWLEEGS